MQEKRSLTKYKTWNLDNTSDIDIYIMNNYFSKSEQIQNSGACMTKIPYTAQNMILKHHK
uniref:Uncharacterized protein n=1 Tax=Arundo donax TaxID=35708 RepID=A0A0A8ZY98_ARUDO